MTAAQILGIVPNQFVLEHLPNSVFPEDDEWVALVRAPEGLTVLREAPPHVEADRWVGFYGGATAHSLDTPGMLAAIVAPLAEARVSVFVASTYHADLVLVPEYKLEAATAALREAGHTIKS
ncbi:ACT domain-containing protein [Actinomadura logoneensis]|uniref:ACT domain-containing protein n=1 Tax=Actinomadura logoneensis TaxID=2293572 RepID=A0A372JC76_9ACTN|nr:ACT domain-containing protein [Actinomadura logoneensis]RFU37434.1 ACT domain-containing protein [Actinomadura logoneensis]